MKPSEVSKTLKIIAQKVDNSNYPSKKLVSQELRRVIAGMKSYSVNDMINLLVAQIHAYDMNEDDFTKAPDNDYFKKKVIEVTSILKNHGVKKVLDLTRRNDLPEPEHLGHVKLAVDLMFIDGDSTISVKEKGASKSGLESKVNQIFDAVYQSLGLFGEKLPSVLASPFEPDHYEIILDWDGSSFVPSEE